MILAASWWSAFWSWILECHSCFGIRMLKGSMIMSWLLCSWKPVAYAQLQQHDLATWDFLVTGDCEFCACQILYLASVFDCSQRIHRLLDLLCLASITLSIIVTLLLSTLRIQNSAPELAHPKGLFAPHDGGPQNLKLLKSLFRRFLLTHNPIPINLVKIWQKGFYVQLTISEQTLKRTHTGSCRCREGRRPKPSQNAFALVYVCHQ